MQNSIWLMFIFVAITGGVGGIVNALMTDNGFLKPKWAQVSDGNTILRPGVVGNVLIGAVAAIISWGLYGPLSGYIIVGAAEATKANASPENVGLSVASFVGGALVGIGGARWLSSEVDKSLLRAAASQAADKSPSAEVSKTISIATPAGALNAALSMK